MRKLYEQFYLTWCYPGRSVSGADGWTIRAKSEKLALAEAEGMADIANYWCPMGLNTDKPPGRRLALFRQPDEAVLAHGVLIAGLVGGRGGVSFEHVVTRLPKDLSVLDGIKLWRASAWQLQDGDFSPKLDPFAWTDEGWGPDFRSPTEVGELGQVENRDGAFALSLLSQPEVIPWASYVLRACLATCTGLVDKFFIAGQDDTIARLLFVAFYCLPERFRRGLTFSTHENPRGTKGVQIVGITTFEGEESDLASYCYNGRYCALNTFNEAKTDSLAASSFAESAMQWILCGQYGLLDQVRDRFNALDPADKPNIGDLDLLAEYPALGDDAPLGTEALLKLCGSQAIGHSHIRDPKELSLLVGQAESNSGFRDALASQLGAWLPQHGLASHEFPALLAQVAFRKLQQKRAFEDLVWLADFATRVGGGLEIKYWEQLMFRCQASANRGLPERTILPAIETRLNLLGVWQQWHQQPQDGAGDAFGEVVNCWLRVQPQELVDVLRSKLSDELKRGAVCFILGSPNPEEFPKVIKLARNNEEFQKHLIAQLAACPAKWNHALKDLASVALADLCSGRPFVELVWLATFAGQIESGFDGRFWEELLMACQPAAGQGGFPRPPVLVLDTRLSLLQEWERYSLLRDSNAIGTLSDHWLHVVPSELIQVLTSNLTFELKRKAVDLCLTANTSMDMKTADAIFSLICSDAQMAEHVFLSLPEWPAGSAGAIGKVPEACLLKLLECYVKQMRLVNSLNEDLIKTVSRWNNLVFTLVPARMRAILSFGQYLRNPASVMQLPGELRQQEFWSLEEDREEAVNGATDRLLGRGSLADYERALDWFGGRWTSSPVELIRNTHSRLVNVPIACQDAALEHLLLVLGHILRESEKITSGGSLPIPSIGAALGDVEASELNSLGRIAMRYLPGSSLLRSPTGQQVIAALHNPSHMLDGVPKDWVQNLHFLINLQDQVQSKITLDQERIGELICHLACAYTTMKREEDKEVCNWINELLLNWVRQQSKKASIILDQFTYNVYQGNEPLFLERFITPFRHGLLALEQETEDGLVATEFFLWCCQEQVLNAFNKRPGLVDGWLKEFLNGLANKSRKRADKNLRRVFKPGPKTLEHWHETSGYRQPLWLRCCEGICACRSIQWLSKSKTEKKTGGPGRMREKILSFICVIILLSILCWVVWYIVQKGISLHNEVRGVMKP